MKAQASGKWHVGLVGALLAGMLLAGSGLVAQEVTIPPGADNYDEKQEPFRMIGNIYWVGHTQVGSFLVKTSAGLILVDTTSPEESQ